MSEPSDDRAGAKNSSAGERPASPAHREESDVEKIMRKRLERRDRHERKAAELGAERACEEKAPPPKNDAGFHGRPREQYPHLRQQQEERDELGPVLRRLREQYLASPQLIAELESRLPDQEAHEQLALIDLVRGPSLAEIKKSGHSFLWWVDYLARKLFAAELRVAGPKAAADEILAWAVDSGLAHSEATARKVEGLCRAIWNDMLEPTELPTSAEVFVSALFPGRGRVQQGVLHMLGLLAAQVRSWESSRPAGERNVVELPTEWFRRGKVPGISHKVQHGQGPLIYYRDVLRELDEDHAEMLVRISAHDKFAHQCREYLLAPWLTP